MKEYRLEELFDLQMGKTPSRNNPEYWTSEDHKWISIGDLSKCGKYISETKEYLSDKAVEESGISLIPEETVVMSFKLSIGKTAITAEPMYSNEAIMSFRDRHFVELLPDYVYYLLSGRDWDEGTNKAVMGKTLNKATLSKIKVKIHGIEQQRDIVSVLDNVSSIITAHQQQLAALDDLIKARFVEMLKNEKTTPIKLKDIVEQNRIITYGMVKPGKDVPGGVIIIKVKDFPNGIVETGDFLHAEPLLEAKYERSRVKEGDLLYSIRGTVGRTAFVTKDLEGSNITQDTARLSIARDRYNANYIRYALGYDDVVRQIESQIKGVAMKGISLSELREIEIPCVKYDSQQAFGVFVEQVDKSKVAVQKALNEAQVLFDSLMQQYFG